MKLINFLIVSILSFILVSCSAKKINDQDSPTPSMEEAPKEEVVIDDILEEEKPIEMVQDNNQMEEVSPEVMGEVATYTVQEGDTLMLVSFKLYGDYRRWREIANQNPSINPKGLKAGTVLSYIAPAEKFEWTPKGIPHLIRQGETLGTISNEKYGTPKKWKDIWENNKPMIIDPNLIFAGFTLHYIPLEQVASQK